MNYDEEMEKILKENMTKMGYSFWINLKQKIEPVWNRPSSSTGKYHNKENGRVPTIVEHTYEMIYSCSKSCRLFNIEPKTSEADVLFLAVVLHDAHKYGEHPEKRKHTDKLHDQITANKIRNIKEVFLKFLNEKQTDILEEAVRYHSGRWSPDAPKGFDFKDYHPYTFFVHMLDMMSSKNLLKIPDGENDK